MTTEKKTPKPRVYSKTRLKNKTSKPQPTKKSTTIKKEAKVDVVEDLFTDNEAIKKPEIKKEEMPMQKKVEDDIKIYNFRFITTCSNLNIANIVFDRKKVVVFEVETDTYERALQAMKTNFLPQFNGKIDLYNQFIHSVFGSDMLVEIVPADTIRREVVEIK